MNQDDAPPNPDCRLPDGQKPSRGLDPANVLIAIFLALVAVLPFWDVTPTFRSDDVLLIAQGHENSILGGALRSFMRPFGDTRSIEFYRPLFSFNFCVEGALFGDNPAPYQGVSLFLHGLSVILSYFFLKRLWGSKVAFVATLIFALSPWSANNVAWIAGRCTTVVTICMFAVGLLHDRGRRSGKQVSSLAFLCALFGVFYRETALFAPAFALTLDLGANRKLSWAAYGFYSIPFAIYLGAKQLVVGTVLGGYSGLDAMRGEMGGLFQVSPAEVGVSLGRLLARAPDPVANAFDGLSFGFIAIVLVAALALLWSGRWRRWTTWLLLFFILTHGALLCMADSVVHPGTSQRWHTVVWAMAAFVGLGLCQVPKKPILWLCVLAISGMQTYRLRSHLSDYDVSAKLANVLRLSINASVEDEVFVYNLKPYYGGAPFFEIGAGQLALPPFGAGKKSVYPLAHFNAYGKDPRLTQTPIAAFAKEHGELASVLWIDYESGAVFDFPETDLKDSWGAFQEIPKLHLISPKVEKDVELSSALEVNVEGINRIEIHLICPLAEMRFSRRRGEGGFVADEPIYREDLRDIYAMASHMIRGSKSRAWLWIAAYEDPIAVSEPKAVSVFIELELRADRF